jgi:hypothetical protein
MRNVSPEIKAKILNLLNEHEEPLRFWDIANGLGYSQTYTRWALASLIQEQSVECIKPRSNRSFKSQGRASSGFDENSSRASFLYRLPESVERSCP